MDRSATGRRGAEMNYLQWLSQETETVWWHDSAEPAEIAQGLA
jgi:hypothetical protein